LALQLQSCNRRHYVDDPFRPNGGYSETCAFDKQKNVGTESESGPRLC
jgi:hypothetical protein